ncbi:MAG: alanine dehydrogenase [Spirochaetes bacterium]|nr:alanine dehydrogenase [Spirochaetota bacterium]
MIVGVTKEIKTDENRVGITPAGVSDFVKMGHRMLIENGAGEGSGFRDEEFSREGATMVRGAAEIFREAEMIIKVKEPQPAEIGMLREGQIIYTYLHLAPDKKLTLALLEKKVIGIAYETIEVRGRLVCLEPMSEIAGKMSAVMGAFYIAKQIGGKGVLVCGVAGVHSANILILGGGTAGINAAKIAAGLGARVVVMDVDIERMRYLEDVLPKNCEMIMSNKINIEYELAYADIIIGSVLITGARAPRLITREMLKLVKPGSVIVDISIDQGGCIETSRPTTHSDPVYEVDGVIHYCVANMPGAYPRTSTFALTNATIPFGLQIANLGWREAAIRNNGVASGINLAGGRVICRPVAEAHGLRHLPVDELLGISE